MTNKKSGNIVSSPNGPTCVFIKKGNGERIEIFRQENMVSHIPMGERDYKIYRLLEENCDLRFCTNEKSGDFNFICLQGFVIFALDSMGNCFGTIGGAGDIEDNEYPVGYVTRQGKCGKIASCFKEFIELVNYYPFWRKVIEFERNGEAYSLQDLKNSCGGYTKQFKVKQAEISDILNLKENQESLELLKSSLRDADQFIVFGQRYENLI